MKCLKIAVLGLATMLMLSAVAAASALAAGELELVNHEGKELVKNISRAKAAKAESNRRRGGK